jgi:hypothetical protein
MLLRSLPSEVWKRIIDFLVAFDEDEYYHLGSHGRKALSQLSQVCRELSSKLRPLLFRNLGLKSSSDLSFLRRAIQSTVSGWLAVHILNISLEYQHAVLPCTTLFPRLPSVESLHYFPNRVCTFPHTTRPQLSYLRSLRTLWLADVTFPSFSAFLRLVGAISALEELAIQEVRWQSICEAGQLPDCKAGFRNLKRGKCISVRSPLWPVTWMFAAASTGYTYRRRGIAARDPEGETPPPEIEVLVRILKLVLTYMDPSVLRFMLNECTDEGSFTTHIC